QEARTHTAIQPESGAAEDTKLFQTVGLRFAEGAGMALRVDAGDVPAWLHQCDELHPVGGEQRLAEWRADSSLAPGWRCPAAVRSALQKQPRGVRMVLATPAFFNGGWRPGWLDADRRGS